VLWALLYYQVRTAMARIEVARVGPGSEDDEWARVRAFLQFSLLE
jgi:hypothetical protein